MKIFKVIWSISIVFHCIKVIWCVAPPQSFHTWIINCISRSVCDRRHGGRRVSTGGRCRPSMDPNARHLSPGVFHQHAVEPAKHQRVWGDQLLCALHCLRFKMCFQRIWCEPPARADGRPPPGIEPASRIPPDLWDLRLRKLSVPLPPLCRQGIPKPAVQTVVFAVFDIQAQEVF